MKHAAVLGALTLCAAAPVSAEIVELTRASSAVPQSTPPLSGGRIEYFERNLVRTAPSATARATELE